MPINNFWDEIEKNNAADIDQKVKRAVQIRSQYTEQLGETESDLLEKQKEALKTAVRKDMTFMRTSPSEEDMRTRMAAMIQRHEVERFPISAVKAIELAILDLYHYGILQPLMDKDNPDITDIWVVGTYGVMYKKYGENHWFTDELGKRIRFKSVDELNRFVEKKLGKEFNLSAASMNAIFADGSRICYRSQAIGFSDWIDGEYMLFQNEPLLVIRRFGRAFSLLDLEHFGMISERMRIYLMFVARISESFLIGGPTGAGKSTLQNGILEFVPQNQLTGILEDTPDAKVRGGFYVRMWSQEPNGEDKGEITIARNLFDTKRMNFNNAVVGEMRDGNTAARATDLALMISGLFSTTIHAITVEKMWRVYVNMLRSSDDRPDFAYAIDLFANVFSQLISAEVIQKKPLVTEIAEVVGNDDKRVHLRSVFTRDYENRKVIFHGLSERMIDRAYKYDVAVPEELKNEGIELY